MQVRNLFQKFDKDGSGDLTTEEFIRGYNKYFDESKGVVAGVAGPVAAAGESTMGLDALLARLDPHNTGRIDYVEWSNVRIFN